MKLRSTIFNILLVTLLISCRDLNCNKINAQKFPVQGIDISHHQKDIDWKLLKEENLAFIFMKATEGGDFKDTRFAKNWIEAEKIGLRKGAYHFFTLCRSGKDQAKNFIESVKLKENDLPPVVDLEFSSGCEKRPLKEGFYKELNDYLKALEEHYGLKPILYVTYEFYNQYLVDQYKDYNFWARDLSKEPEFQDKRKWTFWQHSNAGFRSGISGRVDLNVFHGSFEEFEQYPKK